jgi:hypothetical protein
MMSGWSKGGTRTPGYLEDAGGDGFAVFGQTVIGDDARPLRPRGFDLGAGGVIGHHDVRPRANMLGGDGHGLGVVAGRIRDDATREGVGGKRQDQVGCAADLESAAALQVLALEEHAEAGFRIEHGRGENGGAARQGADADRCRADIVSLDGQGHASTIQEGSETLGTAIFRKGREKRSLSHAGFQMLPS